MASAGLSHIEEERFVIECSRQQIPCAGLQGAALIRLDGAYAILLRVQGYW